MKSSFLVGFFFGLLNLLTNLYVLAPSKNKTLGIIIGSGLLFFNSVFSVLFTKKEMGYSLTWSAGMKASIQSGIIHSLLYFSSILLIQYLISPGYFPGLNSWKQYLLILNINIILFSVLSLIFGFISSTLFCTHKVE